MEHAKLDQLIEQASTRLREPGNDSKSINEWKTEMFSLINAIAELKMPSSQDEKSENSSLDPVDWKSARNIVHEMLDSSLDYIKNVRDRPVWQSLPDDIRTAIVDESLPKEGQSLSSVCNDVNKYILPYARGIIHPRFFGWVSSEGTLSGVIGDMLSATLNLNVAAAVHNGLLVEKTVINWMCQIFGFLEEGAGGLLVSGTSMATVVSMAAARQRAFVNVREDGFANGHRLVAYASTETHGCVVKALELVGLGSKSLHYVPVDENYCIDIMELKSAIKKDRDNGLIPFCIIGNSGKI
jgi:glutamate/tyrosine decarboxylase-like PLP-dependent enzyme